MSSPNFVSQKQYPCVGLPDLNVPANQIWGEVQLGPVGASTSAILVATNEQPVKHEGLLKVQLMRKRANADATPVATDERPVKKECLEIVPVVTDEQPVKNECLEIVPYIPPAQPLAERMNDGVWTEQHRRPEWLPVGWSIYRVPRTLGKSAGHFDVTYYDPEGKFRFRSRKEVCYYLATNERKKVKEPIGDFNLDALCEVPIKLATWYGPEAGVYLFEHGGNTPGWKKVPPPLEAKTVKIREILFYDKNSTVF